MALDLEEFAAFSEELKKLGWTQKENREHRWLGPKRSLVDLLPAGPNLRAAKQIVWPQSQFAMSLAGFEQIFARSEYFTFAPGVRFKVAPPPVIALLKIVAFTEDPYRRRKDLDDLQSLFRLYEENSERLFSDDVFEADLEDIEYANAFLLGSDAGAIATPEDVEIVRTFLFKNLLSAENIADLDRADSRQLRFQMQLKAFQTGFCAGRRQ